LETIFLSLGVPDWFESVSYKKSLSNVGAINVIDHSAEDGMKLSSDFLAAAHKSDALSSASYPSGGRKQKGKTQSEKKNFTR